MFSNFCLRKSCLYEKMFKNIVQLGRPHMTWRMRIACRVTKATNTHAENLVLTAFPLQQWSQERASVLRCTYVACLVRVLTTKA
jgi:hypothetical protein